ncbi:hypothetical protein M011DRAFT_58556 [Sporormia fimetaria CBS 119925]|uniref:DUF7820 domain-containing protein n=1 Tax=Sporormia fimetaria CBS 119925 TaxID=1340428 RepID=A0A6A6VBA0_9PLEO|nr:hypothetical protein M011DRAFT_58556 [Sporormia fimetaria CBS 119925]
MSRRTTSHGGASNDDDDTPVDSSARPDVLGDQNALGLDNTADDDDDLYAPVANGVRPVERTIATGAEAQNQDVLRPSESSPMHDREGGELRRTASQSSAVKTSDARHGVSSNTGHPDTHSSRTAASWRPLSVTSVGSFAPMTQPDASSQGPSHPYAMYPQHAIDAPAAQPDHASTLGPAPTHPYSLYQQTMAPRDDGELYAGDAQTVIPVGFSGANLYHRRTGPDGEEQDMVGPDGHTEQLPPYSRFPEEGPTKAALAAEESAAQARMAAAALALSTAPESPFQHSPVSPVGPLSPLLSQSPIALVPPQSASPVSPIAPGPPPSPIAPTPGTEPTYASTAQPPLSPPPPPPPQSATSVTSASLAEGGPHEKQGNEAAIVPWWKRRVFRRLPAWVAVMIVLLLVVFAIVLGVAVGKVAYNRANSGTVETDQDDPSAQVTGTSQSLFDATPIPTPTSLGALPTGSFALPLGIAQESSKNCLAVSDQLPAWSCKMTFAPLVLSISFNDSDPMASVAPMPKPDQTIQYGIQAPDLGLRPLQLVMDLDDRLYGPAYHFTTMYDKVVVINQDDFGDSFASAPAEEDDQLSFRHRFQVMPGDSPWYCFWNATYVEGYVYVEDNSTAATFTNFPTAWPSLPVETAPAAPTPSANPNPPPPPAPTPPAPPRRRSTGFYPRYAPYPRIVKIEERRLSASPKPYCQRMHLLDDFTLVEALDKNEKPIRVDLDENDPDTDAVFMAEGHLSAHLSRPVPPEVDLHKRRGAIPLQERGDPPGTCHCQWMFQ